MVVMGMIIIDDDDYIVVCEDNSSYETTLFPELHSRTVMLL